MYENTSKKHTLTHVSMWDDCHGWRCVTPEEVYKKGHHTNKFLCELCGQYVSFVPRRAVQEHFKHPKSSHDCNEKSQAADKRRQTNPLGFSLPLKIQILENRIVVHIGFLPLPEDILKRAQADKKKLTISVSSGEEIRWYYINSEWFSSEHIAYLSIGPHLNESYRLSYANDLQRYWPQIVNGIDASGTLFDVNTGKRLPENADVKVGKEYWLLMQRSECVSWSRDDIFIDDGRDIEEKWKLRRVKALILSKKAADFFLQFRARLTNTPACIIPLWPPVVRSSHTLLHVFPRVWFFKVGEGCVEIDPEISSFRGNERLYEIHNTASNSILSVSRFEDRVSVLRYKILRRVEQIPHPTRETNVTVGDSGGNVFPEGIYHALPKDRSVYVTALFDGFVEIIKNDAVIERSVIKGGERLERDVEFGVTLRVCQGMDKAVEICFERKRANGFSRDAEIFDSVRKYYGREIKISHTFGSAIAKISDMPLTRQWLSKQLRRGIIDKRVLSLLSREMRRRQRQ